MRHRRSPIAAAVVTVAFLSAVVFGCFSEKDATGIAEGDCAFDIGSTLPGTVVVVIRDFEFVPADVTVPAGSTVTWINCGPLEVHTTTSDNAGVWDSGFLSPGQIFSRRFDNAGGFDYHCTPHAFMEGRITVQ
jgi:plastocyanin